ncbi:branched-chain amino acid ABC transporter substrate-binding protein [Consotaella salsifontis]|uniref:Amino acid/amide ABC transporter substrate-binding protein, HAAT family n=1 Tax=Consotaella salsifontis TaxID=1365950 RepID=A0A1T4L3Q2_9HYPH|nr:branched-chain amino acid ABC transporter substrate-binding protein [Consotaella salsifontis]SJZ49349.1 amino acid/amide ABC transporter substrate-binding protein, HAAT family [Consotaella salsifontis]
MAHPRLPLPALAALGIILAAAAPTAPAMAASVTVGVAAPLSGPSAVLGEQVLDGAKAAASRLSDGGDSITITSADTECSAEGGRNAAQALASQKVVAVIGFLCTESIEAALPVLEEAAIPTLDVGVRANGITDKREKTGHLVWRLAPRADRQAEALADVLSKRWRDTPFGLVDDGTIYHRGLSDAVRLRLETMGMKPATIDTFRPAEEKQFGLVRRLQRTGVTNFLIAGDRPDVAIIARDASSLGLDLTIVGGESLFDEPSVDAPLPTGVTAIGPQIGFPDLAAPDSVEAEGHFGLSYAAVEIAAQVAETGESIEQALNGTAFSTSLGTVRFSANGDSDLDLTRIYRWDGSRFVLEEEN